MSVTIMSLKSYADFYVMQSMWALFVDRGYLFVGQEQYDDLTPDGETFENYDIRRRIIFSRFQYLNSVLVRNMSYVLRNYVWFAALGEARHGHEYCEYMPADFPEAESRSTMCREGITHSPEVLDNLEAVENIFRQDWSSSAYGGDAWYDIVNTIRFYETYPVVFIDRCADLQHNTGSVFNKDTAARYAGLDMYCQEFSRFLDWKRDVDVLREILPSRFAAWLSPEVADLLVDVLRVFCGEFQTAAETPETEFPFDVTAVNFGQEEWNSDTDDWDCAGSHTHCENCGEGLSSDETYTYQYHEYCYDCYSEMFSECEDCGSIEPNEDMYCVNDKSVCQSCWEEYTECDDCGTHVHNNDITETSDGYNLCSDCYESDAHECACGCTDDDDETIYVYQPTFFDNSDKAYYFCCDDCKAQYQAEHGYYPTQMPLPLVF